MFSPDFKNAFGIRLRVLREHFVGPDRQGEGQRRAGDDVNRADAYRDGYADVRQHPREIGTLEPGATLVSNFDRIAFEDRGRAWSGRGGGDDHGSLAGWFVIP